MGESGADQNRDRTASPDLRAALQHLPQPAGLIELLAEDVRLLWMNEAACAAMQGTLAELTGQRLSQIPGFLADLRELAQGYRTARHSGRPHRFEQELTVNGATCTVAVTAVPLSDGPRFLFFAEDISAQRRLQEKLLMNDRFASIGTLAAGVAHEVNNPLAYLSANLSFGVERLTELRRESGDREGALDQVLPALREALSGAQRVREIVTDLKAFSRPDLPNPSAVDVPALLAAVLRLLQSELNHRCTLVREIAPSVPHAVGHEARLAQVFLHLFNNALESMRDRPSSQNRLRLAVRPAAGEVPEVITEIEDNGVGIPAELLPRVFDPFFTTRAIGNGTGLGLSVCHGIITALGGRIELQSKTGQGTLVRVSLPQAVGEKMRPASDPTLLALPSLPRLAVVDDEPLMGEAIRRMLVGEIDVLPLTTVDELLKLVAEGEKIDAILCDLHLNDRGGEQLLEELNGSQPALAARLGFITGGAVNDTEQAFVRKHQDRVLDKPFTRNGLRTLVKSLIG